MSVQLVVVDQGADPRDIGWLYDFYSFWKEEGAFLTEYSVAIDIVSNKNKTYSLEYSSLNDFSNENSFYAAFKAA